MRRVVLSCAIVAVIASLVVSFQAQAKPSGGNNSLNAKACQQGGYRFLYRSTGTGFATEQDCTSYAAQGGKLTTATPAPTSTSTPLPTNTPTNTPTPIPPTDTPTPTNTPSPTPDPRTIIVTMTDAECLHTDIGSLLRITLQVTGSGFVGGSTIPLFVSGASGQIGNDPNSIVSADANGNFSAIGVLSPTDPDQDPIVITVTAAIPGVPSGSISIPLGDLPVC
jgi:hypothetical protein